MKKVLFTMALLLTLSMGVQASGQKHRHTPQKELVDSTGNGGIEAFSDTTSTPMSTGSHTTTFEMDEDDIGQAISSVFDSMDGKDVAGMIFVLAVLLIIFILAPVLILIVLFYFINKNRKEKMRLAQMAMQQGQPIPEQLLNHPQEEVSDEYQKGLRQCFVGVGLAIFLGFAAHEIGFGIGALVFFIGLGKVVAAKTAERKNNFNDNDLNKQDYD